VTMCSEVSGGTGLDIYVFPDQIKYIGIKDEDIELIVKEHLIQGTIPPQLKYISIKDHHYVFVCIHGTRDKRCGRIGPKVLQSYQEAVAKKGLSDKIHILGSSHIGGHKYAGVIIVYPSGDWYGYLAEKNVEKLVDDYVVKYDIVPEFWRGRIGLTKEEQRKHAGLPNKE